MNEQSRDSFQERSRALFHDSVDGLDMRLRSRLTQARHAAIEASPWVHHALTAADGQSNLEDLELVASSDESSNDVMDMLQDDIEFYDWANKGMNSEPAA